MAWNKRTIAGSVIGGLLLIGLLGAIIGHLTSTSAPASVVVLDDKDKQIADLRAKLAEKEKAKEIEKLAAKVNGDLTSPPPPNNAPAPPASNGAAPPAQTTRPADNVTVWVESGGRQPKGNPAGWHVVKGRPGDRDCTKSPSGGQRCPNHWEHDASSGT